MKHIFKKHIFYLLLILIAIIFLLPLSACRKENDVSSSSSPASSVSEPPVSSEESVVPVVSEEPVDNGIRLVISSPAKRTQTVTEPDFTFSGTSDPAESLTVNGAEIERGADGIFSHQVTLNLGKNTFNFTHKGETKTYYIIYRYVIIESFSPSDAQTYPSGSTLVVNATARNGSLVTAVFNGQTVELTKENTDEEVSGEFVSYNGVFRLQIGRAHV